MPISPHLLFDDGRKMFLAAEQGVQYTRSIGLAPNMNRVVVPVDSAAFDPPGGRFPIVGDVLTLVLIDPTTGESIVLPGETVHEVDVVHDTSGHQNLIVTLKDPRYIIHQAAITGHYNVPHAAPKLITSELDGNGNPIVPIRPIRPKDQLEVDLPTLQEVDHPRSLRELVTMCFEAMGLDASDDFDTSMLRIIEPSQIPDPNPDGLVIGDDLPIYPAVRWEFSNPAREAERLLNEFGFAVTLWTQGVNGDAGSPVGQVTGGDLSNRLVVVKLGEWHPQQRTGFEPPAGTYYDQESSRQTSTGLAPETVVVGGRTVIEEIAELEPVGLDLDGQVKPLAELSYAMDVSPSQPYGRFEFVTSEADFSFADPAHGQVGTVLEPEPADGFPPFTIDEIRRVAQASVWKWYRLPKNQLWKLPMLAELVSTRNINGNPLRKQPYVDLDEWRAEIRDGKFGDNVEIEDMTDRYEVDLRLGVVKFSQITVKIESDEEGETPKVRPAKVTLHWSWESAQLVAPLIGEDPNPDPESWRQQVTNSDFYYYPPHANLSLSNILAHNELVLYRRVPPNNPGGIAVELNREDLDAYAQKLIDQARYAQSPFISAPSGKVVGLVKFSVDGRMRQITWSLSQAGADTILSANRERGGGPYVAPYEEALFRRKTITAIKRAEALAFLSVANPSIIGGGERRNPTPESPVVTSTRPGTVNVVNKSGQFIPAFSFVQIVGGNSTLGLLHVVVPTDNEFVPNLGYAVTQSPLPNNASGYAAISGVSYVRIAKFDLADPLTQIVDGDFISPGVSRDVPVNPELHDGPMVGFRGSMFRALIVYVKSTAGDTANLPNIDSPIALILLTPEKELAEFNVVVTQFVDLGSQKYFLTRKLVPDPDNDASYGWIKDPNDTTDYVVRPFPGCPSIYPGMRIGVAFSHVGRVAGTDKRIHIPRYGDCFGFQANLIGPPETGTSGEKYYNWISVGNGFNAVEQIQSGETYEGFTYPPALLLQSTFRELENALTFVDMGGAHVFITPGSTPEYSNGFIFSGAHNPRTTTDCTGE